MILTQGLPTAKNADMSSNIRWRRAVERFLAAVDASQRRRVEDVLDRPRCGGQGLRSWLRAVATQERILPDHLPTALVEVYLTDPEAAPMHDCEECGLTVPVHVGRHCGPEGEASEVYFPSCPHCGGRTGPYAYWAGQSRN